MGPWGKWEVAMSSLFTIAFTGIFLAFIVVAVIGHVLLIGALVRPFFGKPTFSRPAASKSGLLHAR